METRRDAIREYIENLSDYGQVDLWNDYCDARNYNGDRIESMEDFNDRFCGMSPLDIIRCLNGDFDPNDTWFYFDGSGNCCSTCYPEDEIISQDDIAEYVDEHENDLNDFGLTELLESWNEDEDEDEDDEDPTDYDSEPDDDEDTEALPA